MLDKLLVHRHLLTADASLRHHAQRCGIAAANVCAILAHGMGDFAGALRAYLGALEVARAISERRYETHLLVNLANTFDESGLAAQSLGHSQLALTIARSPHVDELVGDIHHSVGNALAALGDAAQGLASNRRAFDSYAALGLPQKELCAGDRGRGRGRAPARTGPAGRPRRRRRWTSAMSARSISSITNTTRMRLNPVAASRWRWRVPCGRAAPSSARAVSRGGPLADLVGQARARLQLAQLEVQAGQFDPVWAQGLQALARLGESQAQRDVMQAHQLLSSVPKTRGDLAEAQRHQEVFHDGWLCDLLQRRVGAQGALARGAPRG